MRDNAKQMSKKLYRATLLASLVTWLPLLLLAAAAANSETASSSAIIKPINLLILILKFAIYNRLLTPDR